MALCLGVTSTWVTLTITGIGLVVVPITTGVRWVHVYRVVSQRVHVYVYSLKMLVYIWNKRSNTIKNLFTCW